MPETQTQEIQSISSYEQTRLLATSSPAAFAHVTSRGRWLCYDHLLHLNSKLLDVFYGDIKRLKVEIPVRHGKSELVSKYLPAWWLGRRPNDQVMLASYAANFAETWGRKARDCLKDFGPDVFGIQVSDSPSAANSWTVSGHDGIMVTAGVGGGLAGKGADLLIIDDPIPDAEAANSAHIRKKIWDWVLADALTRLQPNGRVILVMARWHEDDISGKIDENFIGQDKWNSVHLPALAEENDELGRKVGDPLCPEMYDTQALEAIRRQGSYVFNALYQQRPSPAEGIEFKRDDMRYWDYSEDDKYYLLKDGEEVEKVLISQCREFQTVDVAASEKTTSDYTVVTTFAATPSKKLICIDSNRQHYEIQLVGKFLMKENDKYDKPRQWIETFGHGLGPFKELTKKGYPVSELKKEHGSQVDKIMRAQSAVALCQNHRFFFPKGKEFVSAFEEEMVAFPKGKNDDQVDTLSYAARLLPTLSSNNQKVSQPKDDPNNPRPSAGIMQMQW